ncbi:MAG: hypothetical protein ABJM86_11650 [Hyphomicrobiales bacterium]
MIKLLAIAAVLMSAQAVDAKKLHKGGYNPNPDGLSYVDLAKVNCDELIGIAKKKNVVVASGNVLVAADGARCSTIYDIRYDYFESHGRSVNTKNGRCRIWSCTGVIDGGGRS